jgi:hypothetical protein
MENTTTFRIDIDGTIGKPLFFDDDFQRCREMYTQAGIVTPSEVATLTYHQQVFLLPKVLLTHTAIDGSVEALQALAATGATLQYFTVRQNFDKEICRQVHHQTGVWLEKQGFPHPFDVRFFWDPGQKLIQSLEAEEQEVFLIDDRATGLLKAFHAIHEKDPLQAQQIRDRVTLVAFGTMTPPLDTGGLRIIPLSHWSQFQDVLQGGEKYTWQYK